MIAAHHFSKAGGLSVNHGWNMLTFMMRWIVHNWHHSCRSTYRETREKATTCRRSFRVRTWSEFFLLSTPDHHFRRYCKQSDRRSQHQERWLENQWTLWQTSTVSWWGTLTHRQRSWAQRTRQADLLLDRCFHSPSWLVKISSVVCYVQKSARGKKVRDVMLVISSRYFVGNLLQQRRNPIPIHKKLRKDNPQILVGDE